MKQRIQRILVAVRDIDRVSQPLLRKAARLARGSRASIELFHAVTDTTIFAGPLAWDAAGTSAAAISRSIVGGALQRLMQTAASDALAGLDVSCQAVWDTPAHEAIIRRAQAIDADLVIAEMPSRRGLRRLSLSNTDWELIRQCPQPLLLTHPQGDYGGPANNVLASIDPLHERDKPAHLDNRIVSMANAVAGAIGGKLQLFHAHLPLAARVPSSAMEPLSEWVATEAEDEYFRAVKRNFTRVAVAMKVPPARRHLRAGRVAHELAAVCSEQQVAIAVLGAVSRSGLKRVFLGNTAETIFTHPPCDLLVVKPRGFRSDVPRRRARGITVIGAPVF